MALTEVRRRPVHRAHRIVVAQIEQMNVNFRAVELRGIMVQSLKNIQTARKNSCRKNSCPKNSRP